MVHGAATCSKSIDVIELLELVVVVVVYLYLRL